MAKDIYKHDISTNWEKAKNFIPKENELIYYDDLKMCKIGDGKTKINDLDFSIQTFDGVFAIKKGEK